jgi:FAD/FMN-containing dehydrogenase
MDTFAMVPPVGISELHMDPPEPVPSTGDAQMLEELTGAALDAFVEAAGPGSGSPLISVELRHVGGALGRQRPGNGALASLDAAFLTYGVGMVLDDDTYRANREALARVREALAPVDSGREYLNFTQHETDPARFYTRETYARLRAVKAAVDPDGLFRANHPIAPAS